ncbi:hypothetical protein ACIF8T_28435 [Streptomyces sp. NPDC085946]|uniref:hypothetical protein n=1 Tax=Streptomyces sp. NPDC085946 TaxID=3365744 RepID=UPI0037D02109
MGAMSASVSVRCPACRRAHLYSAPSYPCACGTAVTVPLDRHGTPAAVRHRAWREEWVAVRCPACARETEWPVPELGCPCGTVLRIPVAGPRTAPGDGPPDAEPETDAAGRPAFRPPGIRTVRDAVTAAALYLRWLGHRDVRRADRRPVSGVGLAAPGLLVHVDASLRPVPLRDVECLWLTAMTESAACVHFSLAGYTEAARARADGLGVPLFVLDLTGTPQPVNEHADAFAA